MSDVIALNKINEMMSQIRGKRDEFTVVMLEGISGDDSVTAVLDVIEIWGKMRQDKSLPLFNRGMAQAAAYGALCALTEWCERQVRNANMEAAQHG